MTLHQDSSIFVAGHLGMVGSAILRLLKAQGHEHLVTRTRDALDLRDQRAVRAFFRSQRIDCVVLAAAKVGGIRANNEFPAEFIYDNLVIEANIVHEAYRAGIERLLFLGSSCIYPKFASQPMDESALLTGPLEPTNEPYAVAKIAGIKLCESYNRQYGVDFRSVMPANLYGTNDNFHPDHSHVIPAMLGRFHGAKARGASEVVVWGTGNPRREFLYVDDMAAACLHVLSLPGQTYRAHTQPMSSHINVGTGEDVTIRELAETIADVVGFSGNIVFDPSKPDGAPRKLLDISRIRRLGWAPKIALRDGLAATYRWFLENIESVRA